MGCIPICLVLVDDVTVPKYEIQPYTALLFLTTLSYVRALYCTASSFWNTQARTRFSHLYGRGGGTLRLLAFLALGGLSKLLCFRGKMYPQPRVYSRQNRDGTTNILDNSIVEVPHPGIVGMHGSMVIRLRPCMTRVHPLPLWTTVDNACK